MIMLTSDEINQTSGGNIVYQRGYLASKFDNMETHGTFTADVKVINGSLLVVCDGSGHKYLNATQTTTCVTIDTMSLWVGETGFGEYALSFKKLP